jgi:hypothetical protein
VSVHDDTAELEELNQSGVFDGGWYLERNADVRGTGLPPLLHFHRYGWLEGRHPNRYFDVLWYLEQNPDVAASAAEPLLHYLHDGEREGRKPIWCFDCAWYRSAYGLPPDAVALAHFLTMRGTGHVAPMAQLWSVLHLPPYCNDPDVGDDAFSHYLDDMLHAGREAFPDLGFVSESGLIDPNYYLINGSDVHEAELDPADHFCRYGWREGRKPNIYFDTQWYLQTNPDVARLGINPLVHYVVTGEAEGRRPVPYFDPLWYRETYDIPAGQFALAHFLTHRRSQKYSPTPMFDVAWYVQQHAEEMGTNRDPFAHFLQAGTYRDLDPSATFNAAEYRRRHIGRPSRHFRHLMHPDRDNPLVHLLRTRYR